MPLNLTVFRKQVVDWSQSNRFTVDSRNVTNALRKELRRFRFLQDECKYCDCSVYFMIAHIIVGSLSDENLFCPRLTSLSSVWRSASDQLTLFDERELYRPRGATCIHLVRINGPSLPTATGDARIA